MENFKTKLDEYYESLSAGADIQSLDLSAVIPSSEELQKCLPVVKEENEAIKKGIADCDLRIKSWQESKKMWKQRQNALLELLEKALEQHGIKSSTNGDVKVSVSTRRTLEVVAEDILEPYLSVVDNIASSLPPFVKVSLDIDKTALAAYLKTDDTLLVTKPESIHYKDSTSVRIS